jgi:hypothetical protein
VVPRTPDGIANQDSVSERRTVMGALGSDRKDIIALPREENRFITDMSFNEASIRKAPEVNTKGEVRPFRAFSMRCHW